MVNEPSVFEPLKFYCIFFFFFSEKVAGVLIRVVMFTRNKTVNIQGLFKTKDVVS